MLPALGMTAPLEVFLVTGEHSGDQLGAKLMEALRAAAGEVRFSGVGGPRMERAGLTSLFPLEEIAVMGISAVIPRLPDLLRRIRQTADAVLARPPDALVIVDSPDFTHRIAARVRRRRPEIPIVGYVSPTVWAWRPGRARKMRAYVDHLLALLPFEPAAHARLGGPPTTYAGHPLIERLAELRPSAEETRAREASPATLLVLPGSRRAEVERLLPVFRETIARARSETGPFDVVIPAVSHLAGEIEAAAAGWPGGVRIVRGEEAKLAAFRRARAALVCSGTATLELALAGVPMVVAYRLSRIEARFAWVVKAPSIVLPNLVLGATAIPEFLHETATPKNLAPALADLIPDGPARAAQLAALAALDGLMTIGGEEPSARAARIVLETLRSRRARPPRLRAPASRQRR